MIFVISLAVGAGVLVGLSRQLNGRLALSTNAMEKGSRSKWQVVCA